MEQSSSPHTTVLSGTATPGKSGRRDPDLRREQRQGTQSRPQRLQVEKRSIKYFPKNNFFNDLFFTLIFYSFSLPPLSLSLLAKFLFLTQKFILTPNFILTRRKNYNNFLFSILNSAASQTNNC